MSAYNHAYREFAKVDKDVLRITGEAIGVEVQQLEPPRTDGPDEGENRNAGKLI